MSPTVRKDVKFVLAITVISQKGRKMMSQEATWSKCDSNLDEGIAAVRQEVLCFPRVDPHHANEQMTGCPQTDFPILSREQIKNVDSQQLSYFYSAERHVFHYLWGNDVVDRRLQIAIKYMGFGELPVPVSR